MTIARQNGTMHTLTSVYLPYEMAQTARKLEINVSKITREAMTKEIARLQRRKVPAA